MCVRERVSVHCRQRCYKRRVTAVIDEYLCVFVWNGLDLNTDIPKHMRIGLGLLVGDVEQNTVRQYVGL